MKTLEEYQAFARALRALCEQHGIGIVGTCEYEGIYGEITLVDLAALDDLDWRDIESHIVDGDVTYDERSKTYELDFAAHKNAR